MKLCLMLAAFLLGCIATEIRWIERMRRLRGVVGTEETERMRQTESGVSTDAANTAARGVRSGEGMEKSLLGLEQHLTAETQASPVPQGSNEI